VHTFIPGIANLGTADGGFDAAAHGYICFSEPDITVWIISAALAVAAVIRAIMVRVTSPTGGRAGDVDANAFSCKAAVFLSALIPVIAGIAGECVRDTALDGVTEIFCAIVFIITVEGHADTLFIRAGILNRTGISVITTSRGIPMDTSIFYVAGIG